MNSSNLKPWIKGQSGNPGGKPRALLTKKEVELTFQGMAKKTRPQIQAILDNENSTMVEVMIAAVMVRVVEQGDATKLQYLIDRAVGKLPNIPEIDEVRQEIQAMTDQELLEVIKHHIPELTAAKNEP